MSEDAEIDRIARRLIHQLGEGAAAKPALMFAFKGSGAIIRVRRGGRCELWGARGRRQDPKTPVEQALMRGLDTA